jgi:mannose-6-phosphate isomerase-like protein (cupin superfamily)
MNILIHQSSLVSERNCPWSQREGEATAPDKFGGALIQGGQSHRISKGDVYIVPPDTIHWYRHVEVAS